MTERRYITAYTGPTGEGYPAYVNISETDPATVTITVRGPRGADGHEGQTVQCAVPAGDFINMLSEAQRFYQP